MVRIEVEGDADIVIRKKSKSARGKTRPDPLSPPLPPPIKADPVGPKEGAILLKQSILDDMEIRVESIFRPNYQDDETAYALSGNSSIDMLHAFTSSEVIKDATPGYVLSVTQKKIDYILKERGGIPGIIVDIHTHPNSVAKLSDGDIIAHKQVVKIFAEHLPHCKVFFGVHAISNEQDCRRTPARVTGKKVMWSSITREHEVAFFDGFSNPIAVSITQR